MDDEQKKRILDQAHANIARLSEMKIRVPDPLLDGDAATRSHDPVRRGWPEGRPPPGPTPPRPSLDVPPATDWAAIEQYVEGRIDMERAFMLAVVCESLGEALANLDAEHQKAVADQRAAHEKQLLELRKGLNDLVVAISRLTAAEQHQKAVLDLRATLPVRRTDVN